MDLAGVLLVLLLGNGRGWERIDLAAYQTIEQCEQAREEYVTNYDEYVEDQLRWNTRADVICVPYPSQVPF